MADILTLTEATPSAELQAMGNPDIDVERYELVRQALVEIAAVLPAAHKALRSQDDHTGLMRQLDRIDEMSRAAQQLATDACRTESGGAVAKKITTQRASARLPIEVNCASHTLRNLMTEQCRIPTGFATYYFGTHQQFLNAGFPESALPKPTGKRTKLTIGLGVSCCYQSEADAWFTPSNGNLELEIHWNSSGPGGCGHPALVEAARMMICALSFWTEPREWKSDEFPVEHLLEIERSDYKMAPELRWKMTPAFRRELTLLHDTIYHTIRRGEMLPLAAKPAAVVHEDAGDGLAAERLARSLIETAKRTNA